MNKHFLKALSLGLIAIASFGAPGLARAEYPDRNLRIIVPIAAGSTTDYVARALAEQLRIGLGQTIVIDNVAGAGGTIGTAAAFRAAPDGYTLLVASSAHTVNPVIYSALPYNTTADFSGISVLVTLPNVLLTSPAKNIPTVEALVAVGRKHTKNLSYGSGGVGSGAHMNAELFRTAAKMEGVHIPYKGTPEVVNALISGDIDFAFVPITTALPFIRNGKLTALALGSATRTPLLPDVPTTEEAGVPGSAHNEWIGLYTRAGTPPNIVRRLNLEVTKVLKSPAMNERLLTVGATPAPTTPEETDAYVKAGIASITKTVKLAKIPVN